MRETAEERFWRKTEDTGSCWRWTAYVTAEGYGMFYDGTRMRLVHRYAYELLVGPIPDEMTLDHLCHTRACKLGTACPHRRCVNPTHLEPATRKANGARGRNVMSEKTHCKRGHAFTPENTVISQIGSRVCRQCRNDYYREQHRRERRAAGVPTQAEWRAIRERQRTHCRNGHLLDEPNIYRYHGERRCRICMGMPRLGSPSCRGPYRKTRAI